jgi:phosphopantetheinyl transferase (holo-ACP synthase)
VFVYPEAHRSRTGWLDPSRPRDFLGRLALRAPDAKFLAVYFRGEEQAFATVAPRKGEVFRIHAELVDGVEPGETTAREVSSRLFHVLARLQERWFRDSPLSKNCGGNDVVDLAAARHQENFDLETGEADPEWLDRHLTAKERVYLEAQPPARRYSVFWKLFAAKEAAHKALAQAGIHTPRGAFTMLEADLFRRRVVHRPTGTEVETRFTDDDAEKVHCVAVLRGGSVGDDEVPGDVLWRVEEVPAGEAPGEFARDRLLDLIAESSDDIPSTAVLAIADNEGIPRVLRGGKPCDWGVSISHSGRFAACSFMIS